MQMCKVMLDQDSVEYVEIKLDILKYFGNIYFLVSTHVPVYFPLGPMDPYAPNNLPI
jgi:hypothetical protein